LRAAGVQALRLSIDGAADRAEKGAEAAINAAREMTELVGR
jgi:hypothetical protein